MPISRKTREAVKEELLKNQPLMDLEIVRRDLFRWLEQLPCPDGLSNGWEDSVRVFPVAPEEVNLTQGICVRLTLRLNTSHNRYIIALMESLTPTSRGVYFATVHVNWREEEFRVQELLEKTYVGHFDDALKAKHNIWTQTFRIHELFNCLNSCALAILGHELRKRPEKKEIGTSLSHPIITSTDFPVNKED